MAKLRAVDGATVSVSSDLAFKSFNTDYEGGLSMFTSGGTNFNINLNPALSAVIFYNFDATTAIGDYTGVNYAARNADGTLVNNVAIGEIEDASSYMLCCAPSPYRGIHVEVGVANGTTTALTAYYWKGNEVHGAWTDLSATDTSNATGGATFAQDGNITWTMPTVGGATGWNAQVLDWTYGKTTGYWTKYTFTGNTDATSTLDQICTVNRKTTRFVCPGAAISKTVLDTQYVDTLEVTCATGSSDTLNIGYWKYGGTNE